MASRDFWHILVDVLARVVVPITTAIISVRGVSKAKQETAAAGDQQRGCPFRATKKARVAPPKRPRRR